MKGEKVQRHALTGKLPKQLANGVAGCIREAVTSGMEMDEALSVILAVVSDHARGNYGDEFLEDLAELLLSHRDEPIRGQVAGVTVRKETAGRA